MLKYLLEKEFKQLMRNRFLPKMIIIMPCIVMLLFPWAATMEIKNINISIVDNNHTVTSQRLINKITSSGYFKLVNVSNTYSDAIQSIEYGEADIALEISNNLENDITKEGVSNIMISANAVDGMKGSIGTSYLASIISDFTNEINEEGGVISQGGILLKPYFKFNPEMDYKVFMIPALMVMILTMICGSLPSLNIVSEKEIGTIEQINVTPVPKAIFIIAKLLPYWIIGFIVLTISILVAWLVYGLIPSGSILTIYCISILYIFTISGFGLIVSNYSNTMQQAMFVMMFFIIILLLMSGLFTPINSMPDWAQAITIFNPLKYFIEIMRSIYLKGSSLKDILPQLYSLFCFFIVLTTWAVISYRKRS
ncbi:MAG: ABC transporter permease [Bacteroidales bacterium]|nr:ABC transporter permease [Bacteroidales bacterium]